MQHDWIHSVLQDLADYARLNNLKELEKSLVEPVAVTTPSSAKIVVFKTPKKSSEGASFDCGATGKSGSARTCDPNP